MLIRAPDAKKPVRRITNRRTRGNTVLFGPPGSLDLIRLTKKKRVPNQKPGIRVNENDRPDIELVEIEGVLDLTHERQGFLRRLENCFAPDPDDVLVPAFLVEKHELRKGIKITGRGEPEGKGSVQGKRVLWEVDQVLGVEPDEARNYPVFSNLTSIDPNERFVFEGDGQDLSMRVLDFLTPVGRGQRGLIVSPPDRKSVV